MTTEITEELRDQFAAAIETDDVASASKLLADEPLLANVDLRAAEHRDHFTNGHPLFRACLKNHEQLAELLLQQGAHPDAPGSNPDDQPELGMPLHFAAVDHRNFRLANLLLDHEATPNGHPNCDQATVERMYYDADQAAESDLPYPIIRRAYARFLPDRRQLEARSVAETTASAFDSAIAEPIKLFARMVDLGGQPPFSAIVRHQSNQHDDLLTEIIKHCPDDKGTPHDHPKSTVFNNIFGAARWHGYPKLVRRIMQQATDRFVYQSALDTIGVSISSHNRDGCYQEYREIIVMQLEWLKSRDEVAKAQADSAFQPLYQIATSFTWHNNYGYRAAIAKPECYIDLAELFVSLGFTGIEHRDKKTGHSPLSAAVKRGAQPGIATYISWLLENGADLRESNPDNVNPKAIAREKGFAEILHLLESSK